MILDVFGTCQSQDANISVSLKCAATVIEGDARIVLSVLPDRCVQSVVTSPPYWGVRDYGVDGQIGLEANLQNYVDELLFTFREVWRVLREDGTMWVNIGDVYASGNRRYRARDNKYPQRALAMRPDTPPGLKPKDLIGVPWRVAFALQRDGWYLRSDIIWQKTNPMPESVRDRPSRSHEYLFLFTKSKRYRFSRAGLEKRYRGGKRSVWSFSTTRSRIKGHHASFPERLVFPCVEASTRKNDLVLDPFCGSGTVGRVCAELNRRFVGIEINSRYARATVEHLGFKTNWLRSVQENPIREPVMMHSIASAQFKRRTAPASIMPGSL